ncbi:ATP-dependent helicase HrpB [Vibrio albus]|uniref:ATP-dependent helicase HrpB n=1 Tax=Vibrio albus TaxID=2200953 RepID=UPI002481AB13|nr:ATP-dependent helicase HrpB [Vibrio albus]
MSQPSSPLSGSPQAVSQLPIQNVLSELLHGVAESGQLILKAAPGAGKSTYFPLQLLKQNIIGGKIIMLEPRRLAARNIATYLAKQLGEKVGQSVGFRVRGENKVSSQTRLEIVTEGIMTRMIQSDPELDGVELLIFDEFHERSIHADTALALSLEVQEALRDDLKLVVMSATLDSEALQSLLPEAVYIESEGRAYPVEHRYTPMSANERLVPAMAKQIRHLMRTETGSLLAFLPGTADIRRLAEQLDDLDNDIDVCPLYGQLSFSQQEKAIAPADKGRRKIVLATNIAETSLTIEGIRIVVDSGLEKVAKFDLRTGITKLDQVRVARSSAEQRAGRAGRLEEGICVRLYSESQLNQQPVVPEPEILHSDLSSLVLELAQWGASADDLCWLDTPPEAALNQGGALLETLGLVTAKGQLTDKGHQAHQLGIEPRLSAMLLEAEHTGGEAWLSTALALVPLLEEPERGITDITHALYRLKQGNAQKQARLLQRASTLARKLGSGFELQQASESLAGVCLALAFPDRVAQRRSQQQGRFVLANGHGGMIADDEPLSDSDYIVAIDLMRTGQDASRIFLAAGLDIERLQKHAPDLFMTQEVADWDENKGRLIAEKQIRIGSIIVERELMPEPGKEQMAAALLTYIRRKGLQVLNWNEGSKALLERVRCGAEWLPDKAWPDVTELALMDNLELWLEPYMTGVRNAKGLTGIDLCAALSAYLGWPLNQEIDQLLPVRYKVPSGSEKKIRYQAGQEPVLSVRMQEMFGEPTSPVIADGRKKIVLELLSPAQRPLQVTSDLAGFWAGAYKEVQKEMKGRYPKHPWPDNPAEHVATTKTKRQLNK